jgi:hypothetical protein
MNLTRTEEKGNEGYLQMLKRFITKVSDCSNNFSGKQLTTRTYAHWSGCHMPQWAVTFILSLFA